MVGLNLSLGKEAPAPGRTHSDERALQPWGPHGAALPGQRLVSPSCRNGLRFAYPWCTTKRQFHAA